MNEKGAMDRAEEFIQLFNRVEEFLSRLVNRAPYTRFERLVELASADNAAVRANANALGQFAKLRNAIVHGEGYPPHIIAMPSPEALSKFKKVVHEVIEPTPLIPTFEGPVRCFSPNETLPGVLEFMMKNDFSQAVVKENNGVLQMLTVEGVAWWLADNLKGNLIPADTVTLDAVIALDPPDTFLIMGPNKTIFDAADAFRNSIHSKATRLYAIVITENGGDRDKPIGFVTPWDLVHNPRIRK
jgi:CBS domain-containing protein